MTFTNKASRRHGLPSVSQGTTSAANQEPTADQLRLRNEYLAATFGEAYAQSDVAPKLWSYMDHVEQCFGTIMAMVGAAAVDNLCGAIGIGADSPCKNLSIICRIVRILEQDASDHRQTIDGVVNKLIAAGSPDDLKDAGLWQTCRCLVLSALGLSTMLFTPTDILWSSNLEITQWNAGAQHGVFHPADDWSRPIRAFLTRMRASPAHPLSKSIKVNSEKPYSKTDDPEALLFVNLSFSSLKFLGGISIEWVDSMDNHLNFDPVRHVLALFRHPVFCAAVYLGNPKDSILAKLSSSAEEFQRSQSPTRDVVVPRARELLQSYRILFAQNKKSRRLYWNTIKPLLMKSHSNDLFLDDLCGRTTPVVRGRYPLLRSMLDIQDGVFRPQDFPLYGQKLCTVQDYMDNGRPRRVADLWQDSRDPEKILSLWFVLILAIVGIILSLIQTALNVTQVWLAYQQLEQR